jgi:hypothetical protein
MRSKSNAPRSTIRQTLYPVIRVHRRRHVNRAEPNQPGARTPQPQYTPLPAESRQRPEVQTARS